MCQYNIHYLSSQDALLNSPQFYCDYTPLPTVQPSGCSTDIIQQHSKHYILENM